MTYTPGRGYFIKISAHQQRHFSEKLYAITEENNVTSINLYNQLSVGKTPSSMNGINKLNRNEFTLKIHPSNIASITYFITISKPERKFLRYMQLLD